MERVGGHHPSLAFRRRPRVFPKVLPMTIADTGQNEETKYVVEAQIRNLLFGSTVQAGGRVSPGREAQGVELMDPAETFREPGDSSIAFGESGSVWQMKQVVCHSRAALDLPGSCSPHHLIASQHCVELAGRHAGEQFG